MNLFTAFSDKYCRKNCDIINWPLLNTCQLILGYVRCLDNIFLPPLVPVAILTFITDTVHMFVFYRAPYSAMQACRSLAESLTCRDKNCSKKEFLLR